MKIEAQALTVRYRALRAVDRIDLVAVPGEILGVVGPNGSGKSTLLKAIAGLVPVEGSLLFDGKPGRPRAIGYMPQDIAPRTALTVVEVVLLGRLGRLGFRVGREDLDAVGAVLEELGITALAPRYIGELSGGQRQLVFLAQALAASPSVLLLDEPISALDLRHQLEVLELLRRVTHGRGTATIAVLHDLNAAAGFADMLALLDRGCLRRHGAPADVLDVDALREVYGVHAVIERGEAGRTMIVPIGTVGRNQA